MLPSISDFYHQRESFGDVLKIGFFLYGKKRIGEIVIYIHIPIEWTCFLIKIIQKEKILVKLYCL